MDETTRTNPTAPMTVEDYAAHACPDRLYGLGIDDTAAVMASANRYGQEIARRLGVDSASGRMPAYVWAMAFERL